MLKVLLKTHPALWRGARALRRRLGQGLEREMALLPHLVPRDRVALDVGGNTGIYCEQLVRLTSQVVVVEANPILARHLDWMFEGRVKVVAAAASAQVGEVVLRIPEDDSLGGLSTVAPENALTGKLRSVTVPARTIDSLELENVGFIKIDVEGHEAAVLAGAQALLRRDRPNILLEAEERHHKGAVAAVRAQLEPLGYTGYMLRKGVLTALSGFDPAIHQDLSGVSEDELNRGHVPETYVNNFVFLPN